MQLPWWRVPATEPKQSFRPVERVSMDALNSWQCRRAGRQPLAPAAATAATAAAAPVPLPAALPSRIETSRQVL